MITFVSRGLKALAVLCTFVLLYLIYASVRQGYPWKDNWLGMLLLQIAVLLLRRAARLLEQGKRSGAVLGLICVLIGSTSMIFTDVHLAVQGFWLVVLGVPLIIVWFQLVKRPTSVMARIPEAPQETL